MATLEKARELVAQLLNDERATAPSGPERTAYNKELKIALKELKELETRNPIYAKLEPKPCMLHTLLLKGKDKTVYKTCAVCNRKVNRKAQEVSQCISEGHLLIKNLKPRAKKSLVPVLDGFCALHQLVGYKLKDYKICSVCSRVVNSGTDKIEACSLDDQRLLRPYNKF